MQSPLKTDVDGEILVQGQRDTRPEPRRERPCRPVPEMVFPVALGTGKRLFEGGPKTKLRV